MLRKLMKYELMATGRVFLPLFAALLIISLVNSLLSTLPVHAPQVIGIIVSVILIIGIAVLTLILTIQRFWNNLLSSEGYLMMTLPVKADSLILSKLFTAAIWNIASAIVVTLSILIMSITAVSLTDIVGFIRAFFERISLPNIHFVVYVIEVLAAVALSTFTGILLLYACMSLSMLVNKRRGLVAFGAYIAITTVGQMLFVLFISIIIALGRVEVFSISHQSTFRQIQFVTLSTIAIEIIICAVFYFATRYMLKRRLNLQ